MKIYSFLFFLAAFVGMLGSAWSFERDILDAINMDEVHLALDSGKFQAAKGCGKKKDATSTTAAE